MRRSPARPQRTGSILPMVAVSVVALVGFTALAIDVGMLMVARTHCQSAADCAAMAGARTLNGDVGNNNNYANAGPNIIAAAPNWSVMSQQVTPPNVSYEIGYYTYDRSSNRFGMILPSQGGTMPTNENWSLARVTVSSSNNSAFGKVFGVMSLQS